MKAFFHISVAIFIGIILSCNDSIKAPDKTILKQDSSIQKDLAETNNSGYEFFTEVKLTNKDSVIDRMPRNNALTYLTLKYYNEITDTSFIKLLKVRYMYTASIREYGRAIIAEINISGKNISEATPKRCYLLYSKDKKKAFFFDFHRLYLVKKFASDTTNLIGGIAIGKSAGYFLVYSYRDTSFVKVFDSGVDVDDKTTAVPIYLNTECFQYLNDYLSFENTDVNNDGLLDFSFKGTILSYCKPNEYGIDINKRKVIRSEKFKIDYVLESHGNRLSWKLCDTLPSIFAQNSF